MATFHKDFPGGHFEIGGVSAHHNVALLVWVIIQADGKEFARGGDRRQQRKDFENHYLCAAKPSG
jgi:hypothetical protein